MVVVNGVIHFFNQNNSHNFNFPKFLISVEMVVVNDVKKLLRPK